MKSVTLVVGGGNGIGQRTAELLLDLGDYVYIADKFVDFWQHSGKSNLSYKQLDVLDSLSINDLAKCLKQHGYSLTGLVYSVGVALTKPLISMKPPEYYRLIELNALAFFTLFNSLYINDLFSKNGASVIAVSSVVASIGARGKIGYAASKGAIDAAIKSLALEYADQKIRFNSVAPGTVRTNMFERLVQSIGSDAVQNLAMEYPLNMGDPDDVAESIVFLLSDMAMWITGNVVINDGGLSAR